ncbi:hypothetical protein LZ199_40975 [Myxococcus sp. QH3KD-4-1]|nr:hypothetical protein [Myxococcus qinghaiensis]
MKARDALVGISMNDAGKTFGPAIVAVATLVCARWFLRPDPRIGMACLGIATCRLATDNHCQSMVDDLHALTSEIVISAGVAFFAQLMECRDAATRCISPWEVTSPCRGTPRTVLDGARRGDLAED